MRNPALTVLLALAGNSALAQEATQNQSTQRPPVTVPT